MHADDPAEAAAYAKKRLIVADTPTHIQYRLREYRAAFPTEYGLAGQVVLRAGRAKKNARRTDMLDTHKKRHDLVAGRAHVCCQRCGRHTKRGGKRHAQMKVWREPCRDTAQVAAAKHHGHQPACEDGNGKRRMCGAGLKAGASGARDSRLPESTADWSWQSSMATSRLA